MAWYLIKFAALLIWTTKVASQCDEQACVNGCGAFDLRLRSCNFDHQVYSSLEKCVCAGIGTAAENEQNLLSCLSCNREGIGSNGLQTYQYWSVTCGIYQLSGEGAAISADQGPSEDRTAFFTDSVLPAIASICPEAFPGIATQTSVETTSMIASTIATDTDSPGQTFSQTSAGQISSRTSAGQPSATQGSSGGSGAGVITSPNHAWTYGLMAFVFGFRLI